jgi:glycerol-3-phosphate acyltransferase PlsY
MIYTVIVLAVVAYLLGSIPSAVWIGKHFYGIDIREHGSHNAGTTNMLRVLGRRAALPVFVIDFLKGFVAVTLSNLVFYHNTSLNDLYLVKILLVVAAVLGHIFPLFAGFKGGKGVATMAGAVMGVDPAGVMVCLAVWVAMLMLTHYVSLSSMIAGATFPIVMMISPKTNGSLAMIIFSFVVAIMLVITHRKNIKRLREGTESKIYIFGRPPRPKSEPPQKEDASQGDE